MESAVAEDRGSPEPPEIENPPEVPEEPEARESAPDELPAVEELTGRIPAAVLAAMEEHFRAKWTGVRRLRPEDAKAD